MQEVIRDKAAAFDAKAGEAIVMVPLILDQARPVNANISLDAGALEAIDEEAKRRGLTRSAYMASAALELIGKPEPDDTTLRRLLRGLLERHERPKTGTSDD